MLYYAIVLALMIVAAANAAIWIPKHVGFWSLGVLFGYLCLMCFGFLSQAASMVGLVLVIPVVLWNWFRWPKLYFLPLSLFAMVAVFVLFSIQEVQYQTRVEQLREKYPFESMATRLPRFPNDDAPIRLREATQDTMQVLDKKLAREGYGLTQSFLQSLHRTTRQDFINSPGFGNARMPRVTHYGPPVDPVTEPVTQPKKSDEISEPAAELQPLATTEYLTELSTMHRAGLFDFVNPSGFGYARDREQVAGFQPHRFARMPKTTIPWKLDRIDLIGMAIHADPVVYISDHLPRMDELAKAPVRSPSAWESKGIAQLKSGEDLVVGGNDKTLHMVGAIRALAQCTECHGCERGKLLGAFAYTLSAIP